MSNALAIAHVTQALALLIEANLQPEIDMAVKVEPRKPPADPPAEPTITVFLYQVTPNTSQRNNDLATRASDGTLLKRPAAALDLHFVISAYGEETELVGQRLIGSVVRTLHEIPILPQDIIELAGEKPHLAGSNLADAVQRVRFSPTVMDIDETSKLWGMLHQTPYSLSVVYQAALVFIEGREVPVPAKPVERRSVRVIPFGAPGAPERPGVPTQAGGGKELMKAPETAPEVATPAPAPAVEAAGSGEAAEGGEGGEKAPAKAAAASKSPAKAPSARARKQSASGRSARTSRAAAKRADTSADSPADAATAPSAADEADGPPAKGEGSES
ncbi:DUF4255 domain-containing protein [Streptomyces monticola]|uniref:DUF4255 domain-containing protein n=1 Tax=Streptomyces monticola TaxID=2666263 RepID=A0ABW2JXH3_9ACTN